MMNQDIFVFDLDGVITNPADSSVDARTIDGILTLLMNNTDVAINTGRSFRWVQANLVDPLRDLERLSSFDRLYIVCEKGGESLVWDGDYFRPQASRYALGEQEIGACRKVFEHNAAQLSTMFWDASKLTMATVEKLPQAELSVFHEQQKLLVRLLAEEYDGKSVRIDPTTIATDVELPSAGKHAGAELVYEWVSQRRPALATSSFTCFGDSRSDYEMARYFASRGNRTVFVFVGPQDENFDECEGVELVRTKSSYSLGTHEYLSKITA